MNLLQDSDASLVGRNLAALFPCSLSMLVLISLLVKHCTISFGKETDVCALSGDRHVPSSLVSLIFLPGFENLKS